MIDLPYNWSLREYQKPTWEALQNGKKRVLNVWHRRAGKDTLALHHHACAAFERVSNYWYLMPEYSQCRKALWDAVNPHTGKKRLSEVFPDEIVENVLVQEMKYVFKNGSTFQLLGSDNYDSLVGSTPAGVTFSEYGLSSPSSWGYIRPMLLENNGWALFNSTPRGKNHLYKLRQMAIDSNDWYTDLLTANDTDVFTPEQLQNELSELQAEHGEDYGKAIWLQEYFCSFSAAIPGAIWADATVKVENEGRLCVVPHTPGFPVHSAWDLGYDDDTAIWFYQVVGEKLNILKYYHNNFKDIEFYAKQLYDFGKKYDWRYGIHYLPHDAFAGTLASGGKTIIQQLFGWADTYDNDKKFNLGDFRRTPDVSKEDGIQAARATFPHCYFDIGTTPGFEHLKSYHRKYDQEKKTFSTQAVHDDSSHASDSFRYLSLSWRLARSEQRVLTSQEALMAGNIRNVSFGDLRKEHFKKKQRERASKF